MTTRYVHARAKLARLLLRAARPLFGWRGRIVERKFCDETRWYDTRARAVCERILNALEMWQMQPYFEAMQQELDALDAFGREVEDLVAKIKSEGGTP